MSYPPVGYVVVRHYVKHNWSEMLRFYKDYETAKAYCDTQNIDKGVDWYYELCEIDIYE